MKKLLILTLLSWSAKAQDYQPLFKPIELPQTTTVFTDPYGFRIGQAKESIDYYGNYVTTFFDNSGFEMFKATEIRGDYNYPTPEPIIFEFKPIEFNEYFRETSELQAF